jgi:hypothetical protein
MREVIDESGDEPVEVHGELLDPAGDGGDFADGAEGRDDDFADDLDLEFDGGDAVARSWASRSFTAEGLAVAGFALAVTLLIGVSPVTSVIQAIAIGHSLSSDGRRSPSPSAGSRPRSSRPGSPHSPSAPPAPTPTTTCRGRGSGTSATRRTCSPFWRWFWQSSRSSW